MKLGRAQRHLQSCAYLGYSAGMRTLPALSALLCALSLPLSLHAQPMKLADYLALTGPAPAAKLAYGSTPSQYAELFLPKGPGPHPVVVLVHGGCWTVRFGGIDQMKNLAGALAAQGIAVWNVEYRRVDEQGGGYPGTYHDMNGALALLRANAARYGLDTSRIVAVGHSAGGQLVQWIAGRSKLPASSELRVEDPLRVKAVVSLGGLANLRREQVLIRKSCGREPAELAGQPSATRTDIFSDTNAADLIDPQVRTYLVTGELDTISPPRVARDFAAHAHLQGAPAEVVILPGASHYDEVAASSPAWPDILGVIRRALEL